MEKISQKASWTNRLTSIKKCHNQPEEVQEVPKLFRKGDSV